MRTRARWSTLVLVAAAVACGDQPTEVVPERHGDPGLVAPIGTIALATASTEDGLSITTDKDDYQPGDTVRLTGLGWPGDDTLDILLEDDPATHDPVRWTVATDGDGAFRDSTYVVDQGDLDVTFTLTATSRSSGRSLAVTFTDGNLQSVALNPASRSTTPTGTASYTINVGMGGSGTTCTVTLGVITSLPAGATVSIPDSIVNATNANFSRTLTITTTAVAPGTYTFTLQAARGGNCQGTGNPTVNGTLVVLGPAAKLAFLQPPTNESATATITPPVTVQVLDAGNNLVSSSAPITLAIGTNAGGGTLSGTLTQNAVSGVATFADLSIDKVGTGYTLTATSAGLTGATSVAFNILRGPAAKLAFTAQPSGASPGGVFPGQPTVAVQDAGGNLINTGPGSGSSIALAIESGTGTAGAALACTANPLNASNGIASFAGCKVNLAGIGYQLRATSGTLTSALSEPFDITASNQAPNVDAGGPYTVAEGTALTLAPDVTDADTDPLTYKWTVTTTGIDAAGQCTFDDDTAKNATVTCTDDSQGAPAGKFTLSLEVSDGVAGAVTDAAELTVSNVAPVAAAAGPYSGDEGEAIALAGSADDAGDNDDPHLTYAWSVATGGIDAGGVCTFDDATKTDAKVTCTDDGTFTLTLVAKDDDTGTSAGSTATLSVANAVPVADAGGDYSGNEGALIQLQGAVTDAGANDTHAWSWQYVAGSNVDAGATCSFQPDAAAEDPKVTCTDDGTVELTLTVTDDDGAEHSDVAVLSLHNVAPIAGAGGDYTGDEGAAVALTGTKNDPGANDTHTYLWTYTAGGDVDAGATCSFTPSATVLSPSVSCTDDGTYQLTLKVTDDDTGMDTDAAALTLANTDPVADAGGPYGGNEGAAIALTGSKSDAGSNDTHTNLWSYTAGAGVDAGATCSFSPSATALSPSVTCTDDGTYQLTLEVTDDDGGEGTSTASLTVANVAPEIASLTKPDGTDLPATIIVAGTLNLRTTFGDDGSNDSHTAAIECEAGAGFSALGTVTKPSFDTGCTFATVGPKQISVRVTDDDGESHVKTHSLTVKYNFDGFYAPVDRPNTMNLSKAGQAIPLKWRLTDATGAPVTNLAAVTVQAVNLGCSLGDTSDNLEEYAAGASGLQNLGNGHYQFNWKTPAGYAGSCKSIKLVFGAGALSYTEGPLAYFSFKK